MKNKLVLGLTFVTLMSLSLALYPGTCAVNTNNSKNKGYCVEGLDGKGKCITDKTDDAGRCTVVGNVIFY